MNIFQAAEKGNLKELTRRLDSGTPVNRPNSDSDCAMHFAAKAGHVAALKLLLKRGADIEAETARCYRPLHFAAAEHHAAAIKLLLLHGADIHAETYIGDTALHFAAMAGDPIIAKLLLQHGADVNARTLEGDTPLINCLCHIEHQPASSKITRKNRAYLRDIHRRFHKRTPKRNFAQQIQVAKLLLTHGADVKAARNCGESAAYYAAIRNLPDILKILLRRGADPQHARTGFLHAVTEACDAADIPTLRHLLKNESKPATWDPKFNPISRQMSYVHQDLRILNELCDAGVDPNHKRGYDGKTPLMSAIADDNGICRPAIVKLLLAHGANPNARDKKGNSPLHLATLHGRSKIVAQLLTKNANTNPRNRDGLTPLDLALHHHRHRIAKLLQQKGGKTSGKVESSSNH